MYFEHPQENEIHLFRQRTPKSSSNLPRPLRNYHRKVASSPYASPVKDSIPTEIPANSPKSHPKSFNFSHSKYHESQDLTGFDVNAGKSSKKKLLKNVQRLNQEIQIMSSQLRLANETITVLTNQLNEVNHKHAMQVQEIHERHEQKLSKMKSDVDKLLQFKGISNKNQVDEIIIEKDLELARQQKKFNENIASVREEYEKIARENEFRHKDQVKTLKQQFVDVVDELKDKFFNEIKDIQYRYKVEVDRAKEEMQKLKEFNSESEGSTALEIENMKEKGHTSVSDLQIIEEISFQHNISKDLDDKNPADLDISLRMLINEIGFENEVSISDILSN